MSWVFFFHSGGCYDFNCFSYLQNDKLLLLLTGIGKMVSDHVTQSLGCSIVTVMFLYKLLIQHEIIVLDIVVSASLPDMSSPKR